MKIHKYFSGCISLMCLSSMALAVDNPLAVSQVLNKNSFKKIEASATGFSEQQISAIDKLSAKIDAGKFKVQFGSEKNNPTFITGLDHYFEKEFSSLSPQLLTVEEKVSSLLEDLQGVYQLEDVQSELKQSQSEFDNLGHQHIHYQQTHEGVPVFGRELKVHIDQHEQVYAVNGSISPNKKHIDAYADINETQAVNQVLEHLGISPESEYELEESPALMFFPKDDELLLAYSLKVRAGLMVFWHYFIDAKTGEVIKRYNRIYGDVHQAEDLDVADVTRSVNVWKHDDDSYYMYDPSLQGEPPYSPSIGRGLNIHGEAIVYDLRNFVPPNEETRIPFHYVVNEELNSNWDPMAISASYNMKVVYDYFLHEHGRKSYDGNGANLQSLIHYLEGEGNAFWTGEHVVYGDGDGENFGPLVQCLDVTGHELTHGVIDTTADLIYEFQSGALNESFADVFGALIDNSNWLLGEDCTIAEPQYLRNMENPHLGLGANSDHPAQPAHMIEYLDVPSDIDNGGVHINSGIPNRAAYLIAEGLTNEGLGTSIGRKAMGRIYYRALTQYLTPTSQFIEARYAITQSAEDLYGENSEAVRAVGAAFDAVGITEIGVNHSIIVFGNVEENGDSAQSIVLTNNSIADVEVTEIETFGLFEHNAIDIPGFLPAGKSYEFDVSLSDTSRLGEHTGNLVITTKAGQTINVGLHALVVEGSQGFYNGEGGGSIYYLLVALFGLTLLRFKQRQ